MKLTTQQAVLSIPLLCLTAMAATSVANAQESDFASELPRIKPLNPDEAITLFETPADFQIQLVASEPDVVDPVAVAWDAKMRMHVVEMRGYSERGDQRLGRVRVLEDKDRNGTYETSTVFADGLSWPTALICFDGGVFVGAAPDVVYLKDTSGDGKADVRQKIFTGFGKSNVQGLLNSFRWGLDNRIHGATSSGGGEVSCVVEGRESKPVNLRGRDFSFDPRELDLRAEPGGAQHGMCFDDWGRKFVCSNSDHAQAVLYDDSYLNRDAGIKSLPPRQRIADDGGQAEVFRSSPVEPWRIVRTRLRVAGKVSGPVEGGGRPAGYFTGATGITIYRGDAWPASMRGTAIIGDVGSNIVHRKQIVPNGTSFVASRIDRESELLRSTDIWFRPVQFANGPDGCLHVLDMYREVIEHPHSLPPEIKKHLDLNSGNDRGRIWRIAPKAFETRATIDFTELNSADLVKLLSHANSWRRETAARLIYESQDKAIVDSLRKTLQNSDSALGRLHAMYSLRSLGEWKPDDAIAPLRAASPRLREHAIKLGEPFVSDANIAAAIEEFTYDADARVRLQAAFSIGLLNDDFRVRSISNGLVRDSDDPLIRMALLSSATGIHKQVFEYLIRSEAFFRKDSAAELLAELLNLAPSHRQQMLDAVMLRVKTIDANRAAMLVAKMVRASHDLKPQLKPHQGRIAAWLRNATRKAMDDSALQAERVAAIETLTLASYDSAGSSLESLLNQQNSPEVQLATLTTLASFDSNRVADFLVANWNLLSLQIRTRAESIIASRAGWSKILLNAVNSEKISSGNVSPSLIQVLASSRDTEVKTLAGQLLKKWNTGSQAGIVAEYQAALTMSGDADAGKKVYQKHCMNCHRFDKGNFKAGFEIGPNLTTIAARGREAILINVLDPNREVNPAFVNWLAETIDGKTFSGMLASESANAIELRRAANETTLLQRNEIEQLSSTGMSLMPEGIQREIDLQAMADLLEFLTGTD